jgi:heme/copper-type cytochrome/quinol oxidase subunit 4
MMTQVQSCVRVYVFTKLKKDDSKLVEVFFFVCVCVCVLRLFMAQWIVLPQEPTLTPEEKKKTGQRRRGLNEG